MANISDAILRALLDGVLTDLMIKTTGSMVYLDDGTTLSAKLADIIAGINKKANAADVTKEINTAVQNMKTEILGQNVPEALDTLKEIADYLDQHEDAFEALQAAIGDKADAATVAAIKKTVDALGSLAAKSTVSESDLDASLREKVNAASEGNHSPANKQVLDGITDERVTAWDGKGTFYVSKTQPAGMKAGDLWAQVI